jgi:hypothetical protein
MTLTNSHCATVARQEIVDYLLNANHIHGKSKAIFFGTFYAGDRPPQHSVRSTGQMISATIGSNPHALRQPRFDHYSMNWR